MTGLNGMEIGWYENYFVWQRVNAQSLFSGGQKGGQARWLGEAEDGRRALERGKIEVEE